MIQLIQSRAAWGRLRFPAWLLCCSMMAGVSQAQDGDSAAPGAAAVQQQASPNAAQQVTTAAGAASATVGHPVESAAGKRQAREAEEAYLDGARKLQHDDLDAAEHQFQRAVQLDPANRNYAIAISVTHEHRVSELVQHASKARMAGDDKTAETLLAEARTIDPLNPLVIEHSGPFIRQGAGPLAIGGGVGQAGSGAPATLVDRTSLIANAQASEGWRIQTPVLAGAIQLAPSITAKSFDLRGTEADVIRDVASAYGIRTIMDESVQQKPMRFNLQNVRYELAMRTAMSMAHVFAVPVDETSVVVAEDTPENRQRLDRQLEETVYLPGMTTDQINELAQVVKSVFDVKQAAIQTGLGGIVIRAAKDVLDPLNQTLKDLIDGSGEVMVEVKLYELDTSRTTTAGASLPTQFSIFNVDQAASSIVNSNQTLVQQAIAQGYITSSATNLEIALALIELGLVKSSLATNLLGIFGGGVFQTGVSAGSGATFNLGLNSSDTRTLDDVQLRVGDHQAANFREGERYPITQSTYTTGLSTAASTAANATINGVSVASLLGQLSGGSSTTIPQVTYEDLGITLKATPVIEKSGRINLLLDLKIEALSGSSLDGNPILESRQFATDLTVADGDSAMMVSNVNKNETAAMTGLPGLSELPGFALPLEDTAAKESNQLVVVVTPHIVRRRSDLIAGPRIPMNVPLAD